MLKAQFFWGFYKYQPLVPTIDITWSFFFYCPISLKAYAAKNFKTVELIKDFGMTYCCEEDTYCK